MINDKGILIKNVYYMLTYAFQILRQSNYEHIATEEFENINDMFAAILGKGIAQQLKQGLYREYTVFEEDLSTLRGKMNLNNSIRHKINRKQLLSCEYDELSVNNLLNQILKLTMLFLIKSDDVKNERKAILKKNLLYFSEVENIDYTTICWSSIRFHKNNQNYRMLINVCNLVLEGLLLSTNKGEVQWATFLDEQRMCRLYEKFILEYYKYHFPEYRPNADQIPWDLDDGIADFLPVMQSDITIRSKNHTLIIDAKYYAKSMQKQYDVSTLHSNNLYQIFTYVKNLDVNNNGSVSGLLLYAKTEETIQPNSSFMMSGNRISVSSLDLNLPFDGIEMQLKSIIDNYLLSEEIGR